MRSHFSNPLYHILYWLFVLFVLTVVFGRFWGNNMAAFFFVSMLFPVVLGTSYFLNYVLVPRFLLKKKYLPFGFYTLYTIIISLYLEMVVLMISFIYLGNFSFRNFSPNARDTILLGVVLYLLVFLGSIFLLIRQVKDNQQYIRLLQEEKRKKEKAFLEITADRKTVKIPYEDILYIESLSDYIKVHTVQDRFVSREKISSIESRLPEMFLRIHRSFIVNKDRIHHFSYNELSIENVRLNIGRTYRKKVRDHLGESKNL